LVPLDFSDYSSAALGWALSFAEPFQATVVLLYVAETIPAGSEFGASHLPQLEADLRKIGRKQLARIKKSEIPPAICCQCLIRAGKADVEIVEAAKSLKVDLIVMASHSHGSQHGQLGSTCERVARFAPCPVLLVPAQEKTVPFFL
jgi:nucleotide-binding universal stress UspA family protein